MKNNLQKKAFNLLNELTKMGIYTSYRSVLNTMYETASDKKEYIKASHILELINEDINS